MLADADAFQPIERREWRGKGIGVSFPTHCVARADALCRDSEMFCLICDVFECFCKEAV